MLLHNVASALLISAAVAVTIEVASTGGIDASPLQYGIMFEVSSNSKS